ncbi:ATP-binding cassette domain-containing protein, partial [bacterium]|nr:ATP-binding cassette domain-containing protein [bacterium]
SYLSRFHFRHDQMDLPVGKISGGEQSRLLLAQLMLGAKSVLILDEPTNDLDIETLDSLQEALSEFPGAVILVSHDRFFMDQVCTEILAIDEVDKKIEKFANVFQWSEWIKGKKTEEASAPAAIPTVKSTSNSSQSKKSNKKLSFKEQHELDNMETTIQKEEAQLTNLEAKMSQAGLTFSELQEATKSYNAQKIKVDQLYARWEELSQK